VKLYCSAQFGFLSFSNQVPLLQPLTKQERMTLADALQPKNFEEGEVIIQEGDVSGLLENGSMP